MKHIYMFAVMAIASLAATSCTEDEIIEPFDSTSGIEIGGVVWAKYNVDAPGTFAATPESRGMYYQWNRSRGWSSYDNRVSTDWDSTQATGEGWESANDPCPTGWRIPTIAEIQSLVLSGAAFTERNGVFGCTFGNGKNTVFFPSAGKRTMSGETDHTRGAYWSSTEVSVSRGYCMDFSDVTGSFYADYGENRAHALSIRCVAK